MKVSNKESRALMSQKYQHQQISELGIHDDCVVQGLIDGHKVVTGHHSQEEVVQHYK
jgi:hypothetical protein